MSMAIHTFNCLVSMEQKYKQESKVNRFIGSAERRGERNEEGKKRKQSRLMSSTLTKFNASISPLSPLLDLKKAHFSTNESLEREILALITHSVKILNYIMITLPKRGSKRFRRLGNQGKSRAPGRRLVLGRPDRLEEEKTTAISEGDLAREIHPLALETRCLT